MRADGRVDGGLLVSGAKKPCSLTWSMDLMSASVAVADPDGGPDRSAVVLVPAPSEGIERRRFWQSWVLAGAESDEVVLTDVHVPEALVFYPSTGAEMDPVQARGFVCVRAAHHRVLRRRRVRARRAGPARRQGRRGDRALLVSELETTTAALEHVATAMDTDEARRPARRVAARALRRRARGGARRHGGGRPRRGHGLHRVVRGRLPARRRPRARLPPPVARRGERAARCGTWPAPPWTSEPAHPDDRGALVDSHNLFLTPTTYRLLRAEYAVALAVCAVLLVQHLGDMRWLPFALLFLYIDVDRATSRGRSHGAGTGGRLHPRLLRRLQRHAQPGHRRGRRRRVVPDCRPGVGAARAARCTCAATARCSATSSSRSALSFEPVTHPAYQEFVDRYDA